MLIKCLIFATILQFSVSCNFGQPKTKENSVKVLINELKKHPWQGAEQTASPSEWEFQFTEPMLKILSIGTSAQNELIESINQPEIKDQIIILLGGVGDERAIEPIIKAMVSKGKLMSTPNSGRINLAANLALTNITVADVIWNYGGGISLNQPPDDSQDRWEKWWKINKSDFNIKKITRSRNYSNYPNYGIYRRMN